mgnify:CR=1 FL=1
MMLILKHYNKTDDWDEYVDGVIFLMSLSTLYLSFNEFAYFAVLQCMQDIFSEFNSAENVFVDPVTHSDDLPCCRKWAWVAI